MFRYLLSLMEETECDVEPHYIRSVAHRRCPFKSSTNCISYRFYSLALLDVFASICEMEVPSYTKSFNGYDARAEKGSGEKDIISQSEGSDRKRKERKF